MCICLGAVSCYSPDPLFKAHRRVPRANANASSLFAHTRILSPANHLARLCGIASSPRDVLETNGPVDVIRGARKFLHPLRYAFKGCGRQPSIACPGPGPVREREREREIAIPQESSAPFSTIGRCCAVARPERKDGVRASS
jgi:hypothetical protein